MKYIIYDNKKYFSLIIVLSFFIFHKIIIVIIGIIISLFEIYNIDIYSISKFTKGNEEEKEKISTKNDSDETRNENINLNNKNESLKLAHLTEESGFIPSKRKKSDHIL